MTKKIVIACDHAGYLMKEELKDELDIMGYEVEDLGTDSKDTKVDYPDYADKLCGWMKKNPGHLGILICGTGIGMSIAANRHSHIRAALCKDGLVAELARLHNDANVLCIGARVIGTETVKRILIRFFEAEFEGGRHQFRVEKLG